MISRLHQWIPAADYLAGLVRGEKLLFFRFALGLAAAALLDEPAAGLDGTDRHSGARLAGNPGNLDDYSNAR
jgi:hypothetical protein